MFIACLSCIFVILLNKFISYHIMPVCLSSITSFGDPPVRHHPLNCSPRVHYGLCSSPYLSLSLSLCLSISLSLSLSLCLSVSLSLCLSVSLSLCLSLSLSVSLSVPLSLSLSLSLYLSRSLSPSLSLSLSPLCPTPHNAPSRYTKLSPGVSIWWPMSSLGYVSVRVW